MLISLLALLLLFFVMYFYLLSCIYFPISYFSMSLKFVSTPGECHASIRLTIFSSYRSFSYLPFSLLFAEHKFAHIINAFSELLFVMTVAIKPVIRKYLTALH